MYMFVYTVCMFHIKVMLNKKKPLSMSGKYDIFWRTFLLNILALLPATGPVFGDISWDS